MDFITQLPKTAQGYDAILVVVCRLTKMIHLIPTYPTVNSAGTASLFRDHVWKLHGIPTDLVSDRGSTFVSRFMMAFLDSIKTRHSKTTADHPQSDGQTERVNRVIGDMLRHYVGNSEHTQRDDRLAAAEFAINNSVQESTGATPFRLNNGRDPRLPVPDLHHLRMSVAPGSKPKVVPSALSFVDHINQGF